MFQFACTDAVTAGSNLTGKHRLMGELCGLAKHCVDWSYRQRNVYEISVSTIKRQGYNLDRFRAAIASEAEYMSSDTYSGSDGQGGIWRVRVTHEGQ